MIKTVFSFLAGVAVALALTFAADLRQDTAEPVPANQDLEQSLDGLADAIRDAGVFVRGHLWYGSAREQAEAYRHVIRALYNGLERHSLMDPDFPDFQELNPRSKVGMDNADQRYLVAVIRGEGTYRVFGARGTSRRLDFTIYGEDDMAASIATLDSDRLVVDEEGNFEVIVGGPERPGNWLPTEPGLLRLMVRQIHSDWNTETPGSLHVDRIDDGRPLYPEFSRAIMAERIGDTTRFFSNTVRRWPELSRTRFHALLPANQLTAPRDTGSEGGLSGRLMVGGHFDLDENEALIVKTWPSTAAYQGIQLGHHWWESLDYANRQTSLTTDQARLSSDGAYYFVVSATDPGVPNWLDTEGFERGVLLLRYDGMPNPELPEEQHPVAKRVEFGALREELPTDEPIVDAETREQQIARRRRHVQERFEF